MNQTTVSAAGLRVPTNTCVMTSPVRSEVGVFAWDRARRFGRDVFNFNIRAARLIRS